MKTKFVSLATLLVVAPLLGAGARPPAASGPAWGLPNRNYGRKDMTCNPAFPYGLRGTYRTNVTVVFGYQTAGQVSTEDDVDYVQKRLAQLAANHPDGPQFEFVPSTDYSADLFFALMYNGNGSDCWGLAAGQARGQTGYLFQVNTQSQPCFSENDDEEAYWFSWGDIVMQEAVEKWYSFIANGWTCN